jgi:hypothetical protein
MTKADFFASCPIFTSASRYEQVRTFRLWLLPLLLKNISRWVLMSPLFTIQLVQQHQWYANEFATLASLLHICGVHDLREMLRLRLGGWFLLLHSSQTNLYADQSLHVGEHSDYRLIDSRDRNYPEIPHSMDLYAILECDFESTLCRAPDVENTRRTISGIVVVARRVR